MNTSAPSSPGRTRSLRSRLIAAFAFLSVLIGVAGGSGVLFVRDIAGSVDSVAHVGSPLLASALRLVGTMHAAEAVVLDALDEPDPKVAERAVQRIATLGDTLRGGLSGIERLAADHGLTLDTTAAAREQGLFLDNAKAALAARREEFARRAEAEARMAEFEGLRRELDERVGRLAARAESDMGEREDRSKTLVQSGAATTDALGGAIGEIFERAYPTLQNAYRLLRYQAQMSDLVRQFLAEPDAQKRDALRKRIESALKSADTVLKRLSARATGDEARQELAQLNERLAKLRDAALGGSGMLALHEEAQKAHAAAETRSAELSAVGRRYESLLQGMVEVAERLSHGAETAADGTVNQAFWALAAIMAAGVLLGLLCGALVGRSIANPLERLTNAMGALSEGALDAAVPDTDRADELGAMARTLLVF